MSCGDNEGDYLHVPKASTASTSLQSLYELQQLGHLCDVVLETSSGDCVSAHRVVLAASSPYFRAMFVGNMLESTQGKISLRNFDSDILQAVAMYAYNAAFNLSANRMPLLMVAADFFQITLLFQECFTFFKQELTPGNCLSIGVFARQHGFTDLLDVAMKYACEHFEEVVTSDEEHIMSLPFDVLKDMISNDYLGVTHEEVVLSAVIRWAHHDLEERGALFPDLMSVVRLPFVSSEFLILCRVQQEFLMHNDQCRLYIDEARAYKMWPHRRWELRHSCRIKSRKNLNLRNSILYPICEPSYCVEQYNINTDTLATLGQSNISNNLQGFSVTAYNGYLYTIGGSVWLPDGSTSYSNSVDRYHLKENVWSKGAPMIHPRMFHAAQLLYGLIYVTGGDSLDEHVSSAECYDPDADQWMEIKSMNHERSDHRLAEVDGLIFAVGGNLEQCLCTGDTEIADYDYLVDGESVEFYDPAKDTWTCVRSTLRPKSLHSASSIGGCLYVLGTCRNSQQSMERYDVQMDQWFSCPSTTIRSDVVRLLSHNGYLYACGNPSSDKVSVIGRYNPSTRTWEVCGNKNWPRPCYDYATEMLD